MAQSTRYTQLFYEYKVSENVQGKKRVALLKKLEETTRKIFQEHADYETSRNVLGAAERSKVESAVLDQIWTGIDEYTERFYGVLAVAVERQNLQRAFVRLALDNLDHGFDALDKTIIYHASLVGDLYEEWYRKFAQTVQGNETAKRLADDDKAGKLPKELYNHYTVILSDAGSGEYSQIANSSFFKEEVSAILAAFDRWIAELEGCDTQHTDVKEQYRVYLSAYRAALAESDVAKLETAWTEVDQTWMDIRHWVQVVHDIEYGYGDPLRCKVTPEFSVRLLDEKYSKENATIQEIQGRMVAYFRAREGPLAQDGISGLKKSMAGIVYLPFQQGVNLFFRFSGQSIPNSSEKTAILQSKDYEGPFLVQFMTEVRLSHGCKIYFDPVSTAARESFSREVAKRVCADPSRSDDIDTIGTIVYHVAAHEIGHAIYSLDTVKDVIKVSTKTLLEEPRAELTALHTLLLLTRSGFISEGQRNRVLSSFMLQDLRRFIMFDSSATRPYLVSAMSNWARAERLGYLTLDKQGKVCFDAGKVEAFLKDCSKQFESILDAEDERNGPGIEKVLEDMQACEKAPIVQHLVEELFHKAKKGGQ